MSDRLRATVSLDDRALVIDVGPHELLTPEGRLYLNESLSRRLTHLQYGPSDKNAMKEAEAICERWLHTFVLAGKLQKWSDGKWRVVL